VAITASSRTAFTNSGRISGVGLASARISGFAAINLTMACVRTPPADNPRNTSAPAMTWASDRASVRCAKRLFSGSMSSFRPS